jgi:hypothetical protein
MTNLDNGFLLVAALCLIFTVGLSTEIAYNLGIVVPFDLDQFMRVRDRTRVFLWALGAMIAALQGVVIYSFVTGDSQQMTIAGVELLVASVWIVLLVRNYLARPES